MKSVPVSGISHIILVSSAKGGVGKSTLAVNIAVALGLKRPTKRIGLLDADVHGPSVPLMLGIHNKKPEVANKKLVPISSPHGIVSLSIGNLASSASAAIAWRGLMTAGAIRQLLKDVAWAPLDCLVIDLPPGTGDAHMSVISESAGCLSGAILVTTPQNVAVQDTRRGAELFARTKVPVIGVVANMAGYHCPKCGHCEDNFGGDMSNVDELCKQINTNLLARIPLDPQLSKSGDSGTPIVVSSPKSSSAAAIFEVAEKLLSFLKI